jgi:hypothetical protein
VYGAPRVYDLFMAKETPEERIRLNLAVTARTRDQLYVLMAQSRSETLTETIRKALSAYSTFLEHVAQGGRVVLEHRDGKKETLRLL